MAKEITVKMPYSEYQADINQAKMDERHRIMNELEEITACSAPGLYSCSWDKRNIIRKVRQALGLERP